jgi:hypothetical protein
VLLLKHILLGAVDDFRTFEWAQIIPYPELVWQQSKGFLQDYSK